MNNTEILELASKIKDKLKQRQVTSTLQKFEELFNRCSKDNDDACLKLLDFLSIDEVIREICETEKISIGVRYNPIPGDYNPPKPNGTPDDPEP